jgi:teichuronic acid biosynthesis glycosyltransferase TuaC
MNLRVGIVTNLYPGRTGSVKGTFIRDVVEHLRSAGVDVTVINYRFNYAAMSLECLIRSARVDLLDAQFVAPAGIVTALSLRLAPYVVTVHRWDILEFPYRYPLARIATLATLRGASGIIAVGRTILSEVTKFVCPTSKIQVIPNAVDVTRFTPDLDYSILKRKLKIPEDHMIILSVGALIPRKGHQYLVQAMAPLLEWCDLCSLVIIGEGPLHYRLEQLARELGVADRVRLVGTVEDSVLPRYYSMADVFVMPSISEGHCVAILEAMSAGKPVVASDIPANAESLDHGKDSFLVPVGNPEALAVSILRLLRDSDLRKRFGSYSRRKVISEFGWETRVTRLTDFYESVLAST